MASPFPGMDPYIEECGLWEDFHNHLIEKVAEQLADAAPEHYLVRTGERSYLVLVESEGKKEHPFLPDVTVTTPQRTKKSSRKKAAATAEAEEEQPAVLRAFITEEHREAFVEVYHTEPEQRLVTCIEVLSPSNKRTGSQGREVYLRKRQSLLLGGVNLVEIDLLRGGERMPMLDPWPDCPYTLLVARAFKADACRVWRGHYRRKLPVIPVPLARHEPPARPDPDLTLDLQPLIEGIYRRHRYAHSISYTKPLTPPLPDEEAAWLAGRLRERQARK